MPSSVKPSLKPPTVIDVTAISVYDGALRDGAPLYREQLGIFSQIERVRARLRERHLERVAEAGEDGTLCVYAAELRIDCGPGKLRTWTMDPRGEVRAFIPEDFEAPWAGRPRESCAHRPGEIVACIAGGYRIGVVLACPPSPEEAQEERLQLGAYEDVYLVGFPEDEQIEAHAHPDPGEIWPLTHAIPDDLREKLEERFARWRRAEAGGSSGK